MGVSKVALEQTLADGTLPEMAPAKAFEPGTSVSRYVVLRRVDAGGMGVVYAAYDPELDRNVALKVLRPARSERGSRSSGRARLVREAQALARLSHGNVVAVHDVGTYRGAVFIAMELVEGETLSRWLEAATRSCTEVLAVLVGAGRGLQAAHDAELVHRDFKPDNVMVEPSGRARVLDFGLARTRDAVDLPSRSGDSIESLGSISVSSPLTVAGAMLGTPAYMAPEQLAGAPCDAASDQFSFCVTAWEALFGQRPFEGDDASSLAAAVLSGEVVTPSSTHDVPAHVRQALRKGLSTSAADRHESMEALLAQLERDPGSRLRRWSALGGLGVVGLVYGVLAPSEPAVCEDALEHLDGAWDDAAKAELEVLIGEAPGFGAGMWPRVQSQLDAYAARWTDAWTDACRATRVHETQSATALDLRMACLDDRRRALDNVVDVLRHADSKTVEGGLDAIATLPSTDRCGDLQYLQARVRPPEAPEVAREVDELRGSLAKIKALAAAGDESTATDAVEPVLARAEALGYDPLLAEVEAVVGGLRWGRGDADGAVELQRSAYFRARAAGHDELARTAAISLVRTQKRPGDVELSREWAAHARAELARSPDRLSEVNLAAALADLHREVSEYDEAVRQARRALELSESDRGRARGWSALATSLTAAGDRDAAREALVESMKLAEEVYGEGHPRTSLAAHNLASALATWDEPEDARPYAQRAVRDYQVSRPDSPSLVNALLTLGLIEIRAGDPRAGLKTLTTLQPLAEKLRGPGHPNVGKIRGNIGLALHDLGDDVGAAEHFEAARDIFAETYGDAHPLVGMAESNLGLATQGRDAAVAIGHYERAMEILDPVFGEDDVRLVATLRALARLERERERPERASFWEARADRCEGIDGPASP